MIANLFPLGATWLVDSLSKLYQKWVNGEELTEAEQAVLAPVIEGYCDQNDIAKQWSGVPFDYSASITQSYSTISPVHSRVETYNYTASFNFPVCGFYEFRNSSSHIFSFLYLYNGEVVSLNQFSLEVSSYVDGEFRGSSCHEGYSSWSSQPLSAVNNFAFTYSVNFPIFASRIEAEAYLKGTGPVTDALNYAKTYQNADWLSDDWKGLLIDPLTNIGLSLNQLTDLAKALGVHAVGNNLSAQELADLLKQSLPAVNPDLLPDAVPVSPTVPNPDLDPIYYPHPNAHPLPSTTPGTTPDPDPGKDPTPGTDPDVDMSSYKVDLQGIFPFCIPFDFIALLKALDAEPVAPCFEFPVVIPALGYEETVRLDMSIFDDVAEVMRLCETVSFIIFLMFATSKVIKW